MILDSLEELEDDDLRAITLRCDELLKKHDAVRKERALSEARATLAAVGLSLKDLGKAKGKPARAPLYKSGHSYQHPVNKALVWNAKGQKPNWLRALEAEGGRAVETEGANDNVPVRKAG